MEIYVCGNISFQYKFSFETFYVLSWKETIYMNLEIVIGISRISSLLVVVIHNDETRGKI